MTAKKMLTDPQREELLLLAKERQTTRGSRKARVQGSLMRKGLATFVDEDGGRRELSVMEVLISYGNPRPWCVITDAGRVALVADKEHRG